MVSWMDKRERIGHIYEILVRERIGHIYEVGDESGGKSKDKNSK